MSRGLEPLTRSRKPFLTWLLSSWAFPSPPLTRSSNSSTTMWPMGQLANDSGHAWHIRDSSLWVGHILASHVASVIQNWNQRRNRWLRLSRGKVPELGKAKDMLNEFEALSSRWANSKERKEWQAAVGLSDPNFDTEMLEMCVVYDNIIYTICRLGKVRHV